MSKGNYLTIEEMKAVTYGGVVQEVEPYKYGFARMTKKQYDFFDNEENRRFQIRMKCTAGISLDFYTDASHLSFDYHLFDMADRSRAQLDLCQNQVLTYTINESPCQEKQGTVHYVIDQSRGTWNRITLWLPYLSDCTISNFALSEEAQIATIQQGTPDGKYPGKIRKKLLCYGDSITQGFDAAYPSQTYAVRLARYFDFELWNAGLSGYIFEADLLDEALPFTPDFLTIAYGTNDWNWASYPQEPIEHMEKYLERLQQLYPQQMKWYLSPVWRGDTAVPTKAGDFEAFVQKLRDVASEKGIVALNGYDAAPHCTEFLADGILHPNDMGMDWYAQRLTKVFLEKYGTALFQF